MFILATYFTAPLFTAWERGEMATQSNSGILKRSQPFTSGISQLLHHSRCASFCLPCSFPRPWRNWGKFRSHLKEASAGRMAVRGFCLLSSQSRCPVWHMVRSVLSCSCHCCHPGTGTVSPTEGKWIKHPPSSSNCSSL